MDKLKSMHAFTKVVEHGSFAEAARQLQQTRSQINRLVINLEDYLAVSLLNRTTRSVTVTPMGQAYYERCKHLLDEMQETENFIQSKQDTPSGDLYINAPMTFGTLYLGSAIVDFMQLYPDIKVRLNLSDEKLDPVSHGFDMSIRISKPSENLNLIEHQIVEIKQVLCASPSFLKLHPKIETLRDLKNIPCIHYGNLPSGNYWKFNGPTGYEKIQIKSVLNANNGEVLKDAAVASLGVVLLPSFIVGPEIKKANLKILLPDYQREPIYLSLLYPPKRHLSSRVRIFIKYMQERYGTNPEWD